MRFCQKWQRSRTMKIHFSLQLTTLHTSKSIASPEPLRHFRIKGPSMFRHIYIFWFKHEFLTEHHLLVGVIVEIERISWIWPHLPNEQKKVRQRIHYKRFACVDGTFHNEPTSSKLGTAQPRPNVWDKLLSTWTKLKL